jgi:protoheme IX farnesyltransferase
MPEAAGALRARGAPGLLGGPARLVLRDYVTLTKPRIMSLLVLTAVCSMVAAAGGAPRLDALVALVVGGALACGGASAFNHVLDRDIDRVMGPRTASRPVAAGRVTPRSASLFGAGLVVLSFLVLTVGANLLAAVLAFCGGVYYVLVYTLWLKRRTAQNIVIGGAAGAFPVLSGWAAADGRLALGALFLFAVVVLWTPPHFWALALLLAPHYEAARVPMLPVVRGPAATAGQMLLYTVVLVAFTVIPVLTGTFGLVYLSAALLLGAPFCWLAWRVWRRQSPTRAGVLFHYTLLYLALLFGAVALDAVVR